VCVVLHTYGKNIYPDTTNLFEYGFNHFQKISVDGLEASEDIEAILMDQDGGYVVLPDGVEFTDLTMELVPDDANNGEATLLYYYEDMPVGSARAKLSKAYLKEHSIKIETTSETKTEKKDGLPKIAKIIIGCLAVVLIVFVCLFVRAIVIRNRRRRRRRQMRARKAREWQKMNNGHSTHRSRRHE